MSDVAAAAPAEIEDDEDTGGLFLRLRDEIKADAEHHAKWRKMAMEWYGLRDNDQWAEEDRKFLEEQGRPPIAMNRIARNIDAVCGHEISNRQEIQCYPREMGDVAVNETATSTIRWYRDESDSEGEESAAFRDAITVGLGWTETRLDHDADPDGAPTDPCIDTMEMIPDRFARRANLVDARRVTRVRVVPTATAMDLFPGVGRSKLDASWAMAYLESDPERRRNRDEIAYQHEADSTDDDEDGQVTLVECQWIEREKYYRVVEPVHEPVTDPTTGQPATGPDGQPVMQQVGEKLVSLAEDEFETMRDRMAQLGRPEPLSQESYRTIRYKAFLGGSDLIGDRQRMEGPDPAQPGKMIVAPGFSYQAITGKWDKKNQYWFGLVAPMADPQRWANKFFSQILHILNSNAKGGIVAELGVFESQEDAERDWSKPDGITWMVNGAVSSNRWAPKPVAQFPAGFDRMMNISVESIGEATGISQELLGLRDAAQPGVLEAQRTQRGLTILAPYFDSLRKFRQAKGKLLLYIIKTQIPDGRLIRIVGEDQQKYVPLMKSQMSSEYDVKVDEAPTSPSVKDRTWALIAPMYKELPPRVQMELLPYSPLPESAVSKIQAAVKQEMEGAQEKPDPKIEQAKAQFELEQQRFQAEMQMKATSQQADIEMKKASAAVDAQIQREKMQADVMMQQEKQASERALAQQKAQDEFDIAAYREQLKAQAEAQRVAMTPPPVYESNEGD